MTPTGTITPSQSEPGSNGNKEVLHTLQISTSGDSPADAISCHTQNTPYLVGGGNPTSLQKIYFVYTQP